ncbi:hypothetical protein BC832DRAFT_546274 [Gaertneriomyces semiglobifer]|nr:hypothetical protein BC832DRAFT_546274 [Gaertneriomyces semiglobifer]
MLVRRLIPGSIKRFTSSAAGRGQYVIVAKDFEDADAPNRRQAIRPSHLQRASKDIAAGTILEGGAIMDDAGSKMIGSVMIVKMDSKADVEKYIREDPYVVNRVWETWQVLPFRPAFPK